MPLQLLGTGVFADSGPRVFAILAAQLAVLRGFSIAEATKALMADPRISLSSDETAIKESLAYNQTLRLVEGFSGGFFFDVSPQTSFDDLELIVSNHKLANTANLYKISYSGDPRIKPVTYAIKLQRGDDKTTCAQEAKEIVEVERALSAVGLVTSAYSCGWDLIKIVN